MPTERLVSLGRTAASFLGAKDVAPFLKAGDHAFDRDGEVVECGRANIAPLNVASIGKTRSGTQIRVSDLAVI
jgi:hypothetical protein